MTTRWKSSAEVSYVETQRLYRVVWSGRTFGVFKSTTDDGTDVYEVCQACDRQKTTFTVLRFHVTPGGDVEVEMTTIGAEGPALALDIARHPRLARRPRKAKGPDPRQLPMFGAPAGAED